MTFMNHDWPVGGTHPVSKISSLHRAANILSTTMVDQVQCLPTRGDLDRVSRRSDRNRRVTIAIVALIAITALIVGYFNSRDLDEVSTATAINTGSIETLNQARNELRASGVPENELPPAITVLPGAPVDVDALVAATQATILATIRTDPQFRGAAGVSGVSCEPSVNPACIGRAGDDSIVPGPAGLSCDPQVNSLCRGPKGDDGLASIIPGPPPFSYTIPNPTQDATAPGEEQLTCRRSNADNNVPTYDCT